MPYKYSYEGKDKFGKKKFSKKFVFSKWVGDYEHNCVRDYDQYIKDALKNGWITEEDVEYVSYFEGSYENACKFYNIQGESAVVYNKESGKKDIIEDSIDIKKTRLKTIIENNTINVRGRVIQKTSAEIFSLLISKMSEQYFFVNQSERENVALDLIYENYFMMENLDSLLLCVAVEDVDEVPNSIRKRIDRLKYFIGKYNIRKENK